MLISSFLYTRSVSTFPRPSANFIMVMAPPSVVRSWCMVMDIMVSVMSHEPLNDNGGSIGYWYWRLAGRKRAGAKMAGKTPR